MYDNDISKSKIHMYFSGNCCTPFITLDAVDIDGYIAQCIFDFADGIQVKAVNPVEDVHASPIKQVNKKSIEKCKNL